jgi:hypothetical protein
VEDHALDRHPRVEHLEEVPRDGLALAILIGREVDLVDPLHEVLQLLDLIAPVGRHHVQRLEVVVDVDAEAGPGFPLVRGGHVGRTAGQIADVADGRLDHVPRAEVAGDGLRLGGGLDDDEGVGHRGT